MCGRAMASAGMCGAGPATVRMGSASPVVVRGLHGTAGLIGRKRIAFSPKSRSVPPSCGNRHPRHLVTSTSTRASLTSLLPNAHCHLVNHYGYSSSHHPRHLTASASTRPPLTDPAHPNLHYHFVERSPTASDSPIRYAHFALSFLEERPALEGGSASVLGWLPAEASSEGEESGLNDFVENRECISGPIASAEYVCGLQRGFCRFCTAQ